MKFVIFESLNIKYAIEVQYIKEIIKLVDVEDFSTDNKFISGNINYHGKKIPVLEATSFFNVYHGDYLIDSFILIIEFENELFGILTDDPVEIIDTNPEDLYLNMVKFFKYDMYFNNEVISSLNINYISEIILPYVKGVY